MKKITDAEVVKIADELNIDLNKLPIDYFKRGIQIEFEHGKENSDTNVTNDDLLMTAKIALAHINEFPDYYRHL